MYIQFVPTEARTKPQQRASVATVALACRGIIGISNASCWLMIWVRKSARDMSTMRASWDDDDARRNSLPPPHIGNQIRCTYEFNKIANEFSQSKIFNIFLEFYWDGRTTNLLVTLKNEQKWTIIFVFQRTRLKIDHFSGWHTCICMLSLSARKYQSHRRLGGQCIVSTAQTLYGIRLFATRHDTKTGKNLKVSHLRLLDYIP